jgi:hypothetical protein
VTTHFWRRSPAFFGYFGVLLGCACGSRGGPLAIPDASSRFVETPSALAVLGQSEAASGLAGAVTFGTAHGRSALYLQFSPEWRAHGAPIRGFLALQPRSGQAIDAEPIQVRVWRVRSPWQPAALGAWSDKPELAPPYVTATASSSPARTLRIDITELLRFAANHPDLDHGMALIAGKGNGPGVSFATGISGGEAPRLEVYTR